MIEFLLVFVLAFGLSIFYHKTSHMANVTKSSTLVSIIGVESVGSTQEPVAGAINADFHYDQMT